MEEGGLVPGCAKQESKLGHARASQGSDLDEKWFYPPLFFEPDLILQVPGAEHLPESPKTQKNLELPLPKAPLQYS